MEKVDAVEWHRSSLCGSNACVEVAKVTGGYLIRDSKDPDGTALSFTEQEWTAFLAGLEAGEFRF